MAVVSATLGEPRFTLGDPGLPFVPTGSMGGVVRVFALMDANGFWRPPKAWGTAPVSR
jgi:hypothetical protein